MVWIGFDMIYNKDTKEFVIYDDNDQLARFSYDLEKLGVDDPSTIHKISIDTLAIFGNGEFEELFSLD